MANAIDLTQYLVTDVFDSYLYDDNDNLIVYQKNLTGSDIVGKADSVEVKNGKGHSLFAKLYSNKQIDVTLKTNTFNFGTLALMCGTSVGTGEGTNYCEEIIIGELKDITYTLNEIPKYPAKVNIYVGGDRITPVINGKTITFDQSAKGKEIKIMPYEYDVDDEETQFIDIKADEFPEACKLVLKTYIKTKKNAKYKNLTIIIPQASVSSDFNLSTSSEVKPSETEIKLSALTENGRLMKIYITDLDENITTISDLNATSTTAGQANLTFTAPVGATSAKVQYKLSTDTTYSDVATSGTSGVYVTGGISDTSTNAIVKGLTSGSDYSFRIVVVGGDYGGNSNEVTVTIA